MPITPITPSGSNAPNDLPSDAAGAVAVPNTLPSDAAGAVAVPNTLPADGAGSVASPVSLPSVAAAAAPRTLTPMVNLDFAAKSYARKGRTVLFDDLLTYTRPSSATFINRRPDVDGGYEYFLDTDFVGSVENLLTYSEDFSDADWSKSQATINANTINAPDGTLTADKFTEKTTAGNKILSESANILASTLYTYSIHLKNNGRPNGRLRIATDVGFLCDGTYDLDGGTFGVSNAVVESSITKLENDWYKISVTFRPQATATALLAAGIYLRNASASETYLGDGVSGIYVWGAQLTESSKALPYVKTLASVVTKTFAETLRVEYDAATGENLGALIEGSSTNLLRYSEDFNSGSWVKLSGATVAVNTTLAPDKTFSADTLIFNTTTVSRVEQPFLPTNLVVHTFSFWARADSNVSFRLEIGASDSGLVTHTATNKWQRFTISATPNALSNIYPQIKNNSGGSSNTLYVWGAQFEALPFASSYIRTEGSAVSRSGDSLNLPVTSIPAPSKKQSMIVNFSAQLQGINDRVYEIGGTGNGRRHMFLTSTNIGYRYQNVVNFTAPLVANTPYNTVSSFDGTSVKFYVDENLIFSSTVADQTDTSTTFKIGADINGSSPFYGHISKFKTYAQALTAQEITLL